MRFMLYSKSKLSHDYDQLACFSQIIMSAEYVSILKQIKTHPGPVITKAEIETFETDARTLNKCILKLKFLGFIELIGADNNKSFRVNKAMWIANSKKFLNILADIGQFNPAISNSYTK